MSRKHYLSGEMIVKWECQLDQDRIIDVNGVERNDVRRFWILTVLFNRDDKLQILAKVNEAKVLLSMNMKTGQDVKCG